MLTVLCAAGTVTHRVSTSQLRTSVVLRQHRLTEGAVLPHKESGPAEPPGRPALDGPFPAETTPAACGRRHDEEIS
jgi:hypothetical protein